MSGPHQSLLLLLFLLSLPVLNPDIPPPPRLPCCKLSLLQNWPIASHSSSQPVVVARTAGLPWAMQSLLLLLQ
jgi:hypothetical protein